MGLKMRIRQVLEGQMNKRYLHDLKECRKEITYQEFSRKEREKRALDFEGQSKCSLQDSNNQKKAYTIFLRRSGEIDEQALTFIEEYFAENPKCQMIFADEDCNDTYPIFRAAFCVDEWLCGRGLGSVIAVSGEVAENLPEIVSFEEDREIRETLQQLIQKVHGFEAGCESICHLDKILFHNRDEKTVKLREEKENKQVYEAELKQDNQKYNDCFSTVVCNKLSIVIPTKDHPDILKQCVESLLKSELPAATELVVVDNGSSEENKKKMEEFLFSSEVKEKLETVYHHEVMDFNFSHMCNMGAALASGDVYLFLNDDMEALEENWLLHMWEQVQRSYTGAVGCKLYYPDSKRIQHVGVMNLPGGPVHKFQFLEEGDDPFFLGRKNVLAVTGACLMVRKELFDKVGTFNEDLTVAYNDVALCMAFDALGYKNVVLTQDYLYHHESLSRGSDLTREKLLRLKKERDTLYQAFPQYYGRDPYYSPYLSHELGDPGVEARFFEVYEKEQKNEIRILENCNFFESEQVESYIDFETGMGYGIVLFENNAMYNRYLVFLPRNGGRTYLVKLAGQYCEETAFWKQEQPNCALCGFNAKKLLDRFSPEEYRIGYLAKSKLSGKKYFSWMEQK